MIVKELKMSEQSGMAPQLERRIKQINGIAGTSTTIFTFKDGSHFKFDLGNTTQAQADGEENSDAKKFAASIKTVEPLKSGFEFIFNDGTKLKYTH
jgi:hypothetical protein